MKKFLFTLSFVCLFTMVWSQQKQDQNAPKKDTQQEMQIQLQEMQKAIDSLDFSQFFDMETFDLGSMIDTSQMNQLLGKDFEMMFGDDLNELFQTEGFDQMMQQSFKMIEEMDPDQLQKLMEGIDFKEIEKMMEGIDLNEIMKMFEMPVPENSKESDPQKELKRI